MELGLLELLFTVRRVGVWGRGETYLVDLTHHLTGLKSLSLGLTLQVLVLSLQALHLLAKIVAAAARGSRALSLLAGLTLLIVLRSLYLLMKTSIRMDASHVLVEVLLSRETLARVALAIDVGAVEVLSWATVFVVYLAFVSKEASRVCKARKFLATFGWALVGTIVLIHVLRPLALLSC